MAVLDRVPVDDLTDGARQVNVARTVLTVIGLVFFAVGWLAGMAVTSVAWCGLAVKAGWLEARPRTDSAARAAEDAKR